jgi:hypothetical protein
LLQTAIMAAHQPIYELQERRCGRMRLWAEKCDFQPASDTIDAETGSHAGSSARLARISWAKHGALSWLQWVLFFRNNSCKYFS